MASLKFTIIDYTSSPSGIITVVDEPVGLDAGTVELRRDENYHGFLGASDGSFANIQFYGDGFNILNAAYENHGIDAYLLFTIEYQCTDDDAYSQIYSGRFSFDAFKVKTGIEGCYCEIAIENGDEVLSFRNRISQKVSLDSRSTFDAIDPITGTAFPVLDNYPALDQTVQLNPLLIRMVDYGTVANSGAGSRLYTMPMSGGNPVPGSLPAFADLTTHADNPAGNEFNLYFHPDNLGSNKNVIVPFTNINAQEFGDFPGCVGDKYNSTYMNEIGDANPIFTFQPEVPFETTKITIDMELSVGIFNGDVQSRDDMTPNVCLYMLKGMTWNDARDHRIILANGGYKTYTAGDYMSAASDQTSKSGLPGGIDISRGPGVGTVYNSISACSIYIDERYGGIDFGTIETDFSTFPPVVGSNALQFSFHSDIFFNPGEQLFLFLQVDSKSHQNTDVFGHPDGSYTRYTPQVVFFSDNYTYRNSYRKEVAGITNAATVETTINSGLTWWPRSGPQGPNRAPSSYIKLTFDSLYKSTECSTYMVNEALSRASEIITDGALPVYSDYFGRTDSLPYSRSDDGPGSLECITNGLLIRGYSPLVAFYMGVGQFSINSPFSSTYTLQASDAAVATIINMSDDSSNIVYIPTASVLGSSFSIGKQVIVQQGSITGKVTIQASSPGTTTIVSPTGSFSTNGVGSQILLTKIADETWLVGAKASMFISFQEMIDALSCIHAIGFSMEDDPHRSGKHLIRVEPIHYFYQDPILMICENVDVVERDTVPKNNIGSFKCGYSKWEAEEAQGLDEFLTARTFRTTLSTLRAGWDKLCKFVASGYAIEATRRKLGTTTTDWRYDKDNFIMCLQRSSIPDPRTSAVIGGIEIDSDTVTGITVSFGGSGYTTPPGVTISGVGGAGSGANAVSHIDGSGVVTGITVTSGGMHYTNLATVTIDPNYMPGYEIEQGNNNNNAVPSGFIDHASGLISPTTVYNYRISPIRNALRWLRYVLASYVNQWSTGQLIFTEGDGNYYASGILQDDPIESRVLHESSTLTLADYADSTITPIFKNEHVKFKYPMGFADWQAISANPYGQIQYNVSDGPWQYGWIQEVKYDLYNGMAEFILKPKIS